MIDTEVFMHIFQQLLSLGQIIQNLLIHLCHRSSLEFLVLYAFRNFDRHSRVGSCGSWRIRFSIEIGKSEIIEGAQEVTFTLDSLHLGSLSLSFHREILPLSQHHIAIVDFLVCQTPIRIFLFLIRALAVGIYIQVLLPSKVWEHGLSKASTIIVVCIFRNIFLQLIAHKIQDNIIAVANNKVAIADVEISLRKIAIAHQQLVEVIYRLHSAQVLGILLQEIT